MQLHEPSVELSTCKTNVINRTETTIKNKVNMYSLRTLKKLLLQIPREINNTKN